MKCTFVFKRKKSQIHEFNNRSNDLSGRMIQLNTAITKKDKITQNIHKGIILVSQRKYMTSENDFSVIKYYDYEQ